MQAEAIVFDGSPAIALPPTRSIIMNYWIFIDNNRIGPLDPQQVVRHPGVGLNTLVWTEGMSDWVPLNSVPELASMIVSSPAQPQPYAQDVPLQGQYRQEYPAQNPYSPQGRPPCPPTHLAWAIITTLFCCLPFGIVSIVYASGVNSAYAMGNYAEAQRKSKAAANWALASAISAVVICLLYLFVFVLILGAGF